MAIYIMESNPRTRRMTMWIYKNKRSTPRYFRFSSNFSYSKHAKTFQACGKQIGKLKGVTFNVKEEEEEKRNQNKHAPA